MPSPYSQVFLAVVRPATAWLVCSLGLLAAFSIDYWATVEFFQRLGVWVATDFAGKPMPLTNTLDLSVRLGAPFGVLGLLVAIRDWSRGQRSFAIAHFFMSTTLVLLSLLWLRVL